MIAGLFSFLSEAFDTWASGGLLMIPLFLLTVYIYYSVMNLYFLLNGHFLLGLGNDLKEINERDQSDVARQLRSLLLLDAISIAEVRHHFEEVRSEYLPIINRRIRFVAVIVTTGPLIGLLGTVSGMLTSFRGMLLLEGDKFENITEGISEALVTTQVGLMISIPAYVILSLIIQKRNRMQQNIARLEQYNVRHVYSRQQDTLIHT